jgi:hypothetical protein
MHHRIALVLLTCLLASCSVERLSITLDEASIRFVDHATLFPNFVATAGSGLKRQVLQLNISSEVDLLDYLKSRGLQTQFRCAVIGNANQKSYGGYGIGPAPEERESVSESPRQNHYVVYTFIDLQADAVEYKNGKPESRLDLKSDRFESLSCHVIGVDKAPARFPRSNDIAVSFSTFQELLQERHRQ